jgi:hypothetical protein
MDLQPYVDAVRHDLSFAAQAGGDDAAALTERLTAPLESAIRLVLLEALSAGAEEITRELAPRSVEVRLRGRDPEFVVSAPIDVVTAPINEAAAPIDAATPAVGGVAEPAVADDDGGTWRVTLRLPQSLRPSVEAAARRDRISLNAWLVRAAAARVESAGRRTNTGRHVTGWVR